MITVKYFGVFVEHTKVSEEELPFFDINSKQLLEIINTKYQINEMPFRIAVNQKMIDSLEHYIIKSGDVVALLPPFSGG